MTVHLTPDEPQNSNKNDGKRPSFAGTTAASEGLLLWVMVIY